MEIKLEHFVHDLVWLLKEDYNESLDQIVAAKTDTSRAFAEGESSAYHQVLRTIENQLSAFGANEEVFKGIAPDPGQKAEFKRADF